MNRHDAAFVLAGVIGGGGAVVHGMLTQWYMVDPLLQPAAHGMSATVRRLVAVLLHFSTFNWVVGAVGLFVAASAFSRQARLATGLLVGSSYLFASLGNLWATHGRHPGWVVYGSAVALIIFGLLKPDA